MLANILRQNENNVFTCADLVHPIKTKNFSSADCNKYVNTI